MICMPGKFFFYGGGGAVDRHICLEYIIDTKNWLQDLHIFSTLPRAPFGKLIVILKTCISNISYKTLHEILKDQKRPHVFLNNCTCVFVL